MRLFVIHSAESLLMQWQFPFPVALTPWTPSSDTVTFPQIPQGSGLFVKTSSQTHSEHFLCDIADRRFLIGYFALTKGFVILEISQLTLLTKTSFCPFI